MAGTERRRRSSPADAHSAEDAARAVGPKYGRYAGLLAVVLLALVTLNTIVTKPNGLDGIPPGERAPPFAAPLAMSSLVGDADVATRPDEGGAGRVPACRLRGPRILNICVLYEHNPVVFALFIESSSCTGVLGEMQSLQAAFPTVRFAAVAMRPERSALRGLVQRLGLTFPVGVDRDGALAALYKVATCTQVTFIEPGGTVESRALVGTPSSATLHSRVAELVAAGTRA